MEIFNSLNSKKHFAPIVSLILAAFCFYASVPLSSANAQDTPELMNDRILSENKERPKSSDPVSLKIIQNYLTASGGIEAHAKIQSIQARGVITEAGRIRNFEISETADGKRHITYKWRDGGRNFVESIGFDGTSVWIQKLLPKKDFAVEITGPDSVHFSHQFWFLHPAMRPNASDFIYVSQGSARVAGRSCHLVVAYSPDGVPSWLYFDKETFLPIRWGGLGKVASADEYLDFRAIRFEAVSGVLYPNQIDLLVETNQFGTIHFTSIQSNETIDPNLFKIPVFESPVLRQKPPEEK